MHSYKLFGFLGLAVVLALLNVVTASGLGNLNGTVNLNYTNPQAFIQQIYVGNTYYYSCYPNPCQNGGYCSTNGLTFTCQCQNGYSGAYCQYYNSINACQYNPCTGGSQCVKQLSGNYYCQCPNGYYGPYCLASSYVCNPNPCFNGGVCEQTGPTTAKCNCPIGYTGSLCETAVINQCNQNPCQNGGICTPLYLNNNCYSYKCTCVNGFGGPNCESIYNPCYTNGVCNCQNGGLCTTDWSTYPYYKCTCQNGYSGPNCQTPPYVAPANCQDIDPVNCPTYASLNYCSNIYSINGISIPNYCAKSCGTCRSCLDAHASCSQWKIQGFCNLYPVYDLCKSTCNRCSK